MLAARLRHLDGAVDAVLDECLAEHLSLAGELVDFHGTLLSRKERDLEHLAGRRLQHAPVKRCTGGGRPAAKS